MASRISASVITRGACGHTAGQIGHIGREIVIGFFDHNGKGLAHGRDILDCRAMLLRVPGALINPLALIRTGAANGGTSAQ